MPAPRPAPAAAGTPDDRPPKPALSFASLGFADDGRGGWTVTVRGGRLACRPLRSVPELLPVEALQAEVFDVTERELIPASQLVVVAETGGAVLAAFRSTPAGDHLLGALVGWGGYANRRPRIVSDFLGVRAADRGLGVGTVLKRLQAAVAIDRGIPEVVWTVDPLRATNAWLNIAKLGAVAHAYERDRYGTGFAPGLNGDLPSDRLHLRWDLASERVRDRLLGPPPPRNIGLPPPYVPGIAADLVSVAIPADIDALLADDSARAARWRFAVREELECAFADGWAIGGFTTAADGPAYLLQPVGRLADS